MPYKLNNDILEIQWDLPSEGYDFSRFDWTGKITQIRFKGVPVTTLEQKNAVNPTHFGMGLYNEFGIETARIVTVEIESVVLVGEKIHVSVDVGIEPLVVNHIVIQYLQTTLSGHVGKVVPGVLPVQLVWVLSLNVSDVLTIDEQIQEAIPVKVDPACMSRRAPVFPDARVPYDIFEARSGGLLRRPAHKKFLVHGIADNRRIYPECATDSTTGNKDIELPIVVEIRPCQGVPVL